MFGIGMPELMLIFVLALLIFGPKELPKIARTIGKAMAELRRASDELRDGIQREVDLADRENEAPSSPAEAVPSTTLAEATPPVPGTQPVDTTAGGQADESGTSAETVTAQVPTDTIAPVPEAPTGRTATEDVTEAAIASAPPEPSETQEGPEAPAEQRSQAETPSHAAAQPVETRNA